MVVDKSSLCLLLFSAEVHRESSLPLLYVRRHDNSLNKFFSSVIARLRAIQEDGGNVREAYEVVLLV